ncbi:MAG: ATP-binding protein [Thermodesulfobacteriota bacterium]
MNHKGKKIVFGLRLKFITFVILVVVTMILGGWYSLERSKRILREELEKRGQSVTEHLAYNARYGVAIEDAVMLQELIEGIINDDDLIYVLISDKRGNVLAKKDKRGAAITYPYYLKDIALSATTPTITSYPSDMEDISLYDIAAPVESKRDDSLEFLAELTGLDEEIAAIKTEMEGVVRRGVVQVGMTLKNIDKKIKEVEFITFSFISIVIAIGIAAIFIFTRIMVTPIEGMAERTAGIAKGDFDQRVDISARDEIGQLAANFNLMARSLQERELDIQTHQERLASVNIELKNLNINLESRVKERTKELKDAYQELQNTHVQLIQSAKMAALGQLVAGITHEINNPLNFIYGNMKFLKKGYDEIKILTHQYEQVSRMDKGVYDEINKVREGLEFSSILEDMTRKIKNCVIGVERMRDIVQNLRRFSRLDEAEFRVMDIREGLDSTLALLGHELKGRIKIVKEYNGSPWVHCYAGQLNQVFMNILVNAIQAIDGKGEVKIRTCLKEDKMAIAISDTGSGIPDEIMGRIFDPFFTTKEPGKGTGLGLSISYSIIERHRGKLYAESIAGNGTTFTIEIPKGGAKI